MQQRWRTQKQKQRQRRVASLRPWLKRKEHLDTLVHVNTMKKLDDCFNTLSQYEYHSLVPNLKMYHQLMKAEQILIDENIFHFKEDGTIVFVTLQGRHLSEVAREVDGTISFEHFRDAWPWTDQVLIKMSWVVFQKVHRVLQKCKRQVFV
jgi:hypothetical protein